jgi:hypothetical protein
MTDPETVELARQDFRARVLAWSTAMDDMTVGVDHVNAAAFQLRELVQTLDGQGIAEDVLLPFLSDDVPALRCGAAMFLLRRGHAGDALPVLESLADNDDYGSVASSADTALLGWRQEQ